MIKQRRYDLDWLRVISVFAVFLHHVLMPFNGDNFHIMNNTHSKLLDDIMVYFEQFRLPLLFFISGVGTVFAFSKRNWISFIKERLLRLLIPLVFGILFLIPPQTFFENTSKYKSYFSSYPVLVSKLKVNHLWFIENLLLMSIFFIPFVIFIKSNKSKNFKKWIRIKTDKYGIMFWGIFLIAIRIITKEFFPSDSKSFFNLSTTFYFGFFFFSGILISNVDQLWSLLLNKRKLNFKLTIIFSLLFYAYYFLPSEFIKPYVTLSNRWRLWYLVCTLLSWSTIITILGYSQVLLNKKSKLLIKLNEAVYPFYLLHQTIIIVFGYYIIKFNVSITIKIISLFSVSLLVLLFFYMFLISRIKVLRFLFGMKSRSN
ncbi:acyltransferase family protein [Tenacibaculum jejuense]|uniref:Acyltyransferase, OpgC_C superfamily n=1 Tax=Tenacibaculum jejuense TaxID=584609 RepID=A0A238UDA7_9FLAO|nr:acyltransferase [Tenacibaculum jejuense]SNR17062.1 Acyltyransferase, OpgC_C superfamily [Tenacibaculum jejuense]